MPISNPEILSGFSCEISRPVDPMSDADGGAGAASRPPAISLPTRPSPADGDFILPSPGPPSFLSGFFADAGGEGDADCPTFSQLLAGAMASPQLTPRLPADGGGDGELRSKPALSVEVAPPVSFAVPAGLSPSSFLESPGFFSPMQGHLGMSHQQVLAQVTAQALQNQHPSQLGKPASQALELATSSHPSQQESLQLTHPAVTNTKSSTADMLEADYSDQRHQILGPAGDKHVDDGYNWRKYGQKQVKGSEYPRSYYKCTHPNCPVKKKVERSLDGQVTEIVYKGQHNHEKPQSSRRGKEGAVLSSGVADLPKRADLQVKSEMGLADGSENIKRSLEFCNPALLCTTDQELGHAPREKLSGSAVANGADAETDRLTVDNERDAKRRNVESTISATKIIESTGPQKAVAEPKIIVQTTSEVDLLDDGYRWRKYGQKVVKGNPNPRSYYKCTYTGCNVRKHVERASTDPKAVVTTYEGKHNHDIPTGRNNGAHQPKPENIG